MEKSEKYENKKTKKKELPQSDIDYMKIYHKFFFQKTCIFIKFLIKKRFIHK